MKKVFRFLIVSALAFFAFVTIFANGRNVKFVDALTLSEGQSLDTVVDTISISDLNYTTNYNGQSYSGQSSINQNRNTNATFSYSEGNTNRSMVFKFKIDVADNIGMNFYFNTTGTNTPNTNGKFYLKLGTQIYESKWNGSSWVDSPNDPLTVGMHTVEMGRIAILDSESAATGNYYVYFKIDGETLKEFTNPYTVADLNPNLYLELSKGSFNKIYDINANYETPQYISVSSLKYGGGLVGDTLDNTGSKKCSYVLDSAVTYKSVVFNADAEVHFDNADQQMSMRLIDSTDSTNWEKEGTSILQTSSVRIMRNKDDGTAEGTYAKVDFSQIGLDDLVVGSTYNIEYGRLAVMNGDTFSGKYHVYYKIDGKEIYSVDQAIKSSVAAGGGLFFSHGSATQFSDTVTYETPKQISVNDLKLGGNSIGEVYQLNTASDFTYDNTNHTANYSLVFKAKYQATDTDPANDKQTQFHFTSSGNKCNSASTVLLKNTGYVYLGKSSADSANVGYVEKVSAFTPGDESTIEFGRLAKMVGGHFTGQYYEYLKINDDLKIDGTFAMPQEVVVANFVMITTGAKAILKDINPTTYETPDEVSLSDLTFGGGSYDTITLTAAPGAASYTATATHKSVVFKFDYVCVGNSNNDIYPQIIFNDSQTSKGMAWLRPTVLGYEDNYVNGNGLFTAAGTYENVEVGKLYILTGIKAGKYRVYVKYNDTMILDYVTTADLSKANIFISGSTGDTIRDINYCPVTYETADEISISDLSFNGKSSGSLVLDAAPGFATYTATAEHKSVVFKFDYVATGSTDNDNYPQILFASEYNSKGMVWLRTDHTFGVDDAGNYVICDPIVTAAGTYEDVEIGKLYITSGPDAGKYRIYAKYNGKYYIDYVTSTDLNTTNVYISGSIGDTLVDINPVAYENADVISISDLKRSGSNLNGALTLEQGVYSNGDQMFTYNATAAHKSVILKFRYESTVLTDAESCQIHFNSSRLDEGLFWIRGDNNFIKKVGPNYSSGGKFTSTGLHDMEIGKIYITGGPDAGKYYLYIKVDGALAAEYITASMPDSNAIRFTGKSGNHMYDVDYLPVEVNSSLYIYKWNVENSGMLFTAKFNKQFNTLMDLTEVGFIITAVNNSEEVFKLPGKLVEEGNYYVVKAALTSLAAEHLASGYEAKVYYKLDGVTGELSSDSLVSSLYNELSDLTGVDEAYVAGLNALKGNVLEVELDEDSLTATGAVKSTDDDAIILTGANSLYSAFILNGKEIMNNQELMVGYTTYKVTLGNNTITLDPQAKEMIYGGSEHFHEINAGHDPDMTAANLAPMTTELGLTSVRLDMSFNDLFDLTSGNKLIINWDSVAAHQSVIDELKAHGGVTDFLGVIWTILPYGYKTWDGAPWEGRTAPTDADNYLLWLQINGEAARLAAELFPDVMNFETWNEAEIMNGIDSTMVKITSIVEGEYNELYKRNEMVATVANYTVAEKAQILTDLMYYMNKGIKESNPDAILTTPSLGCAQITSDTRFPVKSVNFLKALYEAIEDNTPVTGFEVADKDPNNYFQVINVHPYITLGLTTSNWKTGMLEFVAMAEAHNDGGTEIWVTEFGFAQNRYKGSYGANDNPTARADMITVLELADEIDALTKFYFYKVHDYLEHEGAEGNDHWGLYTYAGEIKQIGTGVKNYINSSDSE